MSVRVALDAEDDARAVADRLRAAGFDDADIATLTVDNPRRMLSGE